MEPFRSGFFLLKQVGPQKLGLETQQNFAQALPKPP